MNLPSLRSFFGFLFGPLAGIVLLAGCATEDAFVLDSDLPVPSDTVARVTTDVERDGGRLVRVNTVFAGTVDDPTRRLESIETRFKTGGWVSQGTTATGSTAVCFFTKNGRSCQVRVVRNELDPAMSRIAYRLVPVAPERDGTADPGPPATSAEPARDG
ncbi:MAG: hypothetical protein CBB69_008425 [Phycisphaera sp. TMED9]|nr:MAG: hypothetical protein CBB69_008425 [Phycisphaera sp. TMED9]